MQIRFLSRQHSLGVVAARVMALSLVGAIPAFASSSTNQASDPCQNFDWIAGLQADQTIVLSRVPLQIDDMARALAPGGALENYEPSHGFAELLGNGTPLKLKDDSQAGRPDYALFYAARPASVADSTNAALPKNPYTLVGWAYLDLFDYAQPNPPQQTALGFGRCIPKQAWLIHEAGWHLQDGGFLPTAGAPFPPFVPPNALLWHPRAWDLHVWINLCGFPRIGFMNQLSDGRLVSGTGYAAPTGTFFYPPTAYSTSKSARRQGDISGPFCSPVDQ